MAAEASMLPFKGTSQAVMTALEPSFNFDRDVVSISINRWVHGYAYGNPGVIGRQ